MFEIFKHWLPLALSWFFMALELPFISSVIARMSNPELNLASFGGVAFPLAMLIEAPIVMLLSASTALCVDYKSYRKVFRFMMWMGGGLTLLHIILTATPLYHIVIQDIIGAPRELHHPIRIALFCLIPWTWAIAHRRFHQGVLIRFGKAKSVGVGTFFRIVAISIVLGVGYAFNGISGAAIGGLAASIGVIAEAVFIYARVRPVLRGALLQAPEISAALTSSSFLLFYLPLLLTSILGFLTQPLGSAAMTRMPYALESLAVWPVVSGFSFLFRSWGHALQEITVARLDTPGEVEKLFRFMLCVALGASIPYVCIASSPLRDFIFLNIYGLNPALSDFAASSIIFFTIMPISSAIASYYQGILVHSRRTRHITEAIIIFLSVSAVVLFWGIYTQAYPALHLTVTALSVGIIAQCVWLYYCARHALQRVVVKA